MSTGAFFLHKNIKTYLFCTRKGTFRGLAGVALSRGCDIPRHWNKIVSNIVSFLPLNYSPSVLAVLLVDVLVVVLFSCCCCCLCLLCCRVANTASAATISMPPPPTLPSVGVEVDACYTNANSSPATLLHAICQAPTKGRWQQRGRGGGDHPLGYNKGVGHYPIVWGVELLGYRVSN